MSKTFGERLRKLRREKDIGQKELALYVGATAATISRYENGKQEPSVDMIKKLADYFHTTSDYLLGKSEVKDTEWFYKLPARLQSFIREENIEYLEVAFKAKEENWSTEAVEEVIKMIRKLK